MKQHIRTRFPNGLKVSLGGSTAVALPAAFATGPDYSVITAGVDFAAVSTAILAVFALVAVVAVTMKGGRWVLKALGF